MRPDVDLIEFETYSPTRAEFRSADDSDFDLVVDFDAYPLAPGDAILSFQEGVASYTGTLDTWISEDEGGTSYGGSATLVVDDDTTNSFFAEEEGQALLRFENLFQAPVTESDPAPTQIPLDATIVSARLLLNLSDDENIGDTTIRIHQMSVGWSEASTWNSLGGGVDVGSETSGQIGTFQGDNDPDYDFTRTVNVTSSVQDWLAGTTNYGLAIIREQTDFNDDGIAIHSSEAGTSTLRPQLSVEFTYPSANVAPTVTQSLTAIPGTANEGSEVDLVVGAADPNPLDPLVFSIEGQDVGFATGAGTIAHKVLMENEGSYPFSASVRDDEVTVPAGSTSVFVLNVAPVILDIRPDSTVDIGRVFEYWVDAADPGVLDVVSYDWDLDGDGYHGDGALADGETWIGQAGTFDLAVIVSDDDGGSNLDGFRVTVADLPADGDFDSDGTSVDNGAFADPDDETALAFCTAGPGVPPAPPVPYVAENCLSAFDVDGDVDGTDAAALLAGTPAIPAVPVGPWSVVLAAAALSVAGFRSLARRSRDG